MDNLLFTQYIGLLSEGWNSLNEMQQGFCKIKVSKTFQKIFFILLVTALSRFIYKCCRYNYFSVRKSIINLLLMRVSTWLCFSSLGNWNKINLQIKIHYFCFLHHIFILFFFNTLLLSIFYFWSLWRTLEVHWQKLWQEVRSPMSFSN